MLQRNDFSGPLYSGWLSAWNPGVGFVFLLLFVLVPFRAHGSTVTVNMELDHPLLRQLLIKRLFNTPQQSVDILRDPSGCNRIELANPRVSGKQASLEIVTAAKVDIGVAVLGGCKNLLQWEGSAGFLGRPVIASGATALRFDPRDSWLVDSDGKKITDGRIWELAKDQIKSQFGRFSLDLKPSIDTLGTVLPDVLSHRSTGQLQRTVDSLRLHDVQVSATRLDVSLSFDVEQLPEQSQPDAVLSPEDLQKWDARWQMMDAFFTYAVKYYASATSVRELHDALLEILLDSRYRLREALAAPANRADDPVRHWFLVSWKRLGPVIRKISLEQRGQEPLLWISLLTATEALGALDRLGPAIGLDISAEGLRRLARLIDDQTDVDPLYYDEAVDAKLRRLFQLPAMPEPDQRSGYRFDRWFVRSAWAETARHVLDRWVPRKDQLSEYLPLVASLLKTSAEDIQKEHGIAPPFVKLFRKLVLTTAWQESCWRQYKIEKEKIVPLRSDSGDVGMMQVNERVWRGFFELPRLRWDIAYNSRAGGEILHKYLLNYALKNAEHKHSGGFDNLARASYAAYNGGPGQFKRYRDPDAAAVHRKVDTAFWSKYQQVSAGKELHVAQCFGLKKNVAAVRPTAKTPVKRIEGKRPHSSVTAVGQGWVMAQEAHRFTLQLAVFSQRESAQKFIRQLALTGPVGIYPKVKDKATQFAVLYGSYANRTAADQEKRRLARLKPWVRRFGEIRKN